MSHVLPLRGAIVTFRLAHRDRVGSACQSRVDWDNPQCGGCFAKGKV
jgi:hypothetical protein